MSDQAHTISRNAPFDTSTYSSSRYGKRRRLRLDRIDVFGVVYPIFEAAELRESRRGCDTGEEARWALACTRMRDFQHLE